MQLSAAQLHKIPATMENFHISHKFMFLCNKKIKTRIMALPQNALFLISFGEYTFNTISNSHKLPQLNSFIAVSNKISRKGGKPNARVKGVNLMRGFEGNG